MLFITLLVMVAGVLMISAGLSSGDNWKHPWSPITDFFTPKPVK